MISIDVKTSMINEYQVLHWLVLLYYYSASLVKSTIQSRHDSHHKCHWGMVAKIVVIEEEIESLQSFTKDHLEKPHLQVSRQVVPKVRMMQRDSCRVPFWVLDIFKSLIHVFLVNVDVLSNCVETVKILCHLFSNLCDKVIYSDFRFSIEHIELD